jgi:hypothetical protein
MKLLSSLKRARPEAAALVRLAESKQVLLTHGKPALLRNSAANAAVSRKTNRPARDCRIVNAANESFQ